MNEPVQQACKIIKEKHPELVIITDVCLCEYTEHGHCGVLENGCTVNNDETLPLLAKVAVSHAQAGADMIAPSNMMDGYVKVIRQALDEAGFENIPIMAYSAKFASAYYGPFRAAADSTPSAGDRKGYQMDTANSDEALREVALDIEEGADIIMVKPALAFLDVVQRVHETFNRPLCVYNVSGEYAMVKAAAEKAGLKLFLGSYPITPATDVLHELSKHKSLGVITVQCEDEISGCATAIGASFAGALAVTTTSGPGVCLKSEAMNLAVITELPLVVLDVQRGGPSTGLPTKSEQTDLLQALFGRNGESPMPVIAATSPTNCFDAAYAACKMALEHMTPVVLLTDGFVANGSGSWKLPNLDTYPEIKPQYVTPEMKDNYTPYKRNPENQVRYWAVPGQEGYTHILGGLEKDSNTGAISTDPENHNLMCHLRAEKVAKIAVPDVEVQGCADDADLLIVGFGGTYGHLYSAMEEMNKAGQKVALAHFSYINPLPKNTAEVLKKYKKVVVAEQNLGQFAGYLRMKIDNFTPYQFNEVKGQPFVVAELVAAFNKLIDN